MHALAIAAIAVSLPLTAWIVGRAVVAWQNAKGALDVATEEAKRARHADAVIERLSRVEQDIQSLANKVALRG